MKTEELLRKQLASRLNRIRERLRTLNAEAQLVEQLLADAEKGSFRSSTKLRKNSVRRLNVQGQIRRHMEEHDGPVRAQNLYDVLRINDPSLKSSTFRSHLKRMVDAGIIKQEGSRGYYRLMEIPSEGPKETNAFHRKVGRVTFRYI